jgi:hypothetical protein
MRFPKNVINALAVVLVSTILVGCGSTKTTSKSKAEPAKNLMNQ